MVVTDKTVSIYNILPFIIYFKVGTRSPLSSAYIFYKERFYVKKFII
nr:MAG TPA: hypothetical protein [Caudoviricetes sp.]